MAEEEAALAEVMNLLQTEPEPLSGSAGGIVPTAPGPDIPALREQLAMLVSTGKAKEAIGVQLTHKQVKRLSDRGQEIHQKVRDIHGLKDNRKPYRQLHFSCNQSGRNVHQNQRH